MNIVEIAVVGKNMTGAAFAEAEGSARGFGKTLNTIGTIGAVAVAGIAVESVKMATKFDSAMTMINTQAGVSKNQIAGLSQGVLDLAGKVGFSPDSLADALYHIESSFASVGIKGPQALNLLKVAAEGAAVGHANLVDVTNALDAVIASGVGGVKNYSSAMGILNATVGAGDMKMQDLADAFGTGILASVKGFGIQITDVGAALAVFGDNNIRGAQAGTDLRMAIQALAAPTKQGDKIFQSWGMTQNQLADDMRKHGLLYALEDLQTQMRKNGVSAQEQGQIITEAFGKKAGVGLQVLMGQMDRLKSKYPELTKAAGSFGTAVATNNATVAQKLKDLQGSFDSLMIEVGNKVLPVFVTFIDFLTRHFNVIAPLIGVLLGLAAALKLVAVAQGILNLVMDANPFILIGVAVIALTALIIKYHTQIWNFVIKIWHDIFNFLKKTWDDIWSFAKQWWPLIFGPAGLIIKYHNDIWNFIQRIWHDVEGFLRTAWNNIWGIAKQVWPMILGPAGLIITFHNQIWGFIQSIWNRIIGFLRNNWDSILATARSIWGSFLSFFRSIPSTIEGYFKNAANWLYQAGKDVIQGFLNGLKSVWNAVVSFISGIASWIAAHKGPLSLDKNLLYGHGHAIMDGFHRGLLAKYADVKKLMSGVAGTVAGAVGGSAGQVQQLMQQMAASIGWTGGQWAALNSVEMREAGYNLNAQNPSSGAYGLAQFINGPSEYYQYGGNPNTPAGQITAMFNYIKQRYGNPGVAWQHELNYGWYDNGGWLKPGYTLAYNGTGRPEPVGGAGVVQIEISGGQSDFDKFMLAWLRNQARIKGGGNVQLAFGRK